MILKARETYRLEEQGGFFIVVTWETSNCPICQTLLSMRGTRQRVLFYKSDAEKQILIIRRLYCPGCERIHHELPDCIVPYKRYSAEAIEDIVSNQTKDPPCPADTARRIRRWWDNIKGYFFDILRSLVEKFGVNYGEPPAFREIVRAVANSNNWFSAQQLCTCSAARTG